MRLEIPKKDYDFETLVRVAHRLGSFFTIEITSNKSNWLLEWEISEELAKESSSRIRNEIYDQIIRDKLHKETKPLRDLIFAAAFSNIDLK